MKTREFTGRHMLLIMVAFFAVIISVNMTMAVLANASWTGFVVRNSYVASQHFNERAAEGRAQAALGWNGELAISDGRMVWRLTDASGSPIRIDGAKAVLRRPVAAREDRELHLSPDSGGAYAAAIGDIGDGLWIVEVEAEAGLARPYRDTRRVTLVGGTLR